jgi:hypothetical protein
LEQIAIEAAYVKQLAEKYGVPETAIRLTTNSLPSTPAAAAAAGDAVGVSAAEAQAASVTASATGGESTDVAAIAGVESFPDVSPELAPLNGAQIAAVLSILENLRAGDLTSEAAETLMVSAGMAKESASKVAGSVAGLPKQPSKVSASAMHNRIRLARAQEDSNLVTINFADGSYIPNDAMIANAKRALAAREKATPSNRGMTAVGLARARDILNKRPLSEDTVRRMKAYFDRHEIDKQGATWKTQGKGWQAWNGWGGDAGQSWANAIVERLNKPQANSAKNESRTEFSAATEVAMVLHEKPENPNDWLTAVEQYRKQLDIRCGEAAKPIVGKSIIEHTFATQPTSAKK